MYFESFIQACQDDITNKCANTTLTIRIPDPDELPPVFEEPFYYAYISDIKFTNATWLEVKPKNISAHDGDTGSNEDIIYNIQPSICMNQRLFAYSTIYL